MWMHMHFDAEIGPLRWNLYSSISGIKICVKGTKGESSRPARQPPVLGVLQGLKARDLVLFFSLPVL